MFVPITINQEDILGQFNISQKEVDDLCDKVIKDIAAAFYVEWQDRARNTLKSTKSAYINSLSLIDSGRMSGAIVLNYTNPLVRMIEEGASAFNMKDSFAKSDKRKPSYRKGQSTGWYLTIPLSAGTPDVAESSGFANIIPSEVYSVVKEKNVNPITNRSQGLTKSEIPEQYQAPKTRAAISIPESELFKEYKHKASVFQGLYKQKDQVTGQNSYGTFRRVSDKSDPESWIHPGMEAANLAEKSFDQFESKMQEVLEDSMDNALNYFGIS